MSKICKDCDIEKPCDKFQVNNRVCIQCKSKKHHKTEYFSKYYHEHKEENKKYRDENKDKFKQYYQNKKEEIKEKYKIKHANDIKKPRGRPKKNTDQKNV